MLVVRGDKHHMTATACLTSNFETRRAWHLDVEKQHVGTMFVE